MTKTRNQSIAEQHIAKHLKAHVREEIQANAGLVKARIKAERSAAALVVAEDRARHAKNMADYARDLTKKQPTTIDELIVSYGFKRNQRVYKIACSGERVEGIVVGARIFDEHGDAGISVELTSSRRLHSRGGYRDWSPVLGAVGAALHVFGHHQQDDDD